MIRPSVILAALSAAGAIGCGVPVEEVSQVARAASAGTPNGGVVLTPAGLVHKECLHEIPVGSSVKRDGTVALPNGKVVTLPECPFPSARVDGSGPIPNVNSWVADVQAPAFTNSFGFNWFNGLNASFSVPSAPASYVGQTIFFFPGFSPSDNSEIIQPVLQYGPSGAGGGRFWGVANWYVPRSGPAMHDTLRQVAAGSTISTSMRAGGITCPNSGVCEWTVGYMMPGFAATDNFQTKTVMRTAFKAALEAYNVSNCNQFPAAGRTNFFNVFLSMPGPQTFNQNDVTGIVGWGGFIFQPITPACGYNAQNTSATTAELDY
jgi:hypothetical protein